MDLEFKTSLDLYKRLVPALTCKENELKKYKIDYIKKEDIWNYLINNKWDNKNLSLDKMVDDILNTDNDEIDRFVKMKFKEMKQEVQKGEIELL